LREKWIDVRPFDRENTFPELLSGKYGHVLGVYCSQIDAFGMAPLEAQMAGISTVILDSGGARETILTNVSGEPVWYLVQSEEDLFRTISHYVQKKMFPKSLSNVNFFHNRAYYTPERLSSDLLSIIDKTPV
jgi:glycosyltransferase involved in cell wall biosynthesis